MYERDKRGGGGSGVGGGNGGVQFAKNQFHASTNTVDGC